MIRLERVRRRREERLHRTHCFTHSGRLALHQPKELDRLWREDARSKSMVYLTFADNCKFRAHIYPKVVSIQRRSHNEVSGGPAHCESGSGCNSNIYHM